MTTARPRMLMMLALLFVGCSSDGPGGDKDKGNWGAAEDTQPGPDQRVLVEVAGVEIGTVANHLITTGVLESEAQADITPLGSGTVTRVMAEEGDTVRPGQVLAVIENVSLASGADRATIELDNAKRAVAEAESLHSRGAISDRELREANSTLAVANAGYKEARASAGFTRLTSPIAGTVSLRNVRVGEVAQPSQPAFQVVDLDRLRVIVQLPEKDLPRVSTGLPVTLTGAYDEEAGATGQVERISPVVQASSGTVRVTIGVDSENTSLRPGQFVKVRIEVDRHSDVFTIPRRGLVWDDGEPVAWTVVDAPAPEPSEDEDPDDADADADADDEGGWMADLFGDSEDGEDGEDGEDRDEWEGIPRRGVVKNRLEVGFVDPDWVEVVSGLTKTDQIITLGNGSLRDETLVRLVGDPDPPEKKDDADGEDGDFGKKKRKGKRHGEG